MLLLMLFFYRKLQGIFLPVGMTLAALLFGKVIVKLPALTTASVFLKFSSSATKLLSSTLEPVWNGPWKVCPPATMVKG